jgi:hypothetical protein
MTASEDRTEAEREALRRQAESKNGFPTLSESVEQVMLAFLREFLRSSEAEGASPETEDESAHNCIDP